MNNIVLLNNKPIVYIILAIDLIIYIINSCIGMNDKSALKIYIDFTNVLCIIYMASLAFR